MPPPEISDIQPSSGEPGTLVTITGSNFGTDASEITVTFGGASAPIQDVATTRIEAEVPEDASDGPVQVRVGEESVTGPAFDVIPPMPEISDVQPSSAQPGTDITITGSNFGTDASQVTVTFGGVSASVRDVTSTEIGTTVPEDASDGVIAVTVGEKEATGPEFDVIPKGRIAFFQNDGVYVSKPDGSDLEQITTGNDVAPAISPSGSMVGFERIGDDENIYTVKADGSDLNQITTNTAEDIDPGWSPDENQLVFSSDRLGDNDIFVINTDGSNPEEVTVNIARDVSPDWSPDGSRIAFESDRDNGRDEIYTIRPDGSDLVRVTNNNLDDFGPAWSPDGSKIAFFGDTGNDNFEIYTVSPDGSDLTRITDNSADDREPAWSPDGDRIVFESNRDGEEAIYTIRPNGTDLVRVATGSQPDWGVAP